MHIKQPILAILTISVLALTTPVALAEVKIAVVDVQTAILQSEEAKRLMAQIQTEFKTKEDEIREIQSEAAGMLERAQKDAEVMTESEKRKLQQQIESKNNDFVTFDKSYNARLRSGNKSYLPELMPRSRKLLKILCLKKITT